MNARVPPPPRHELLALARKYRTLAALRRAKSRGEAVPPRDVFRALAEEFPGALRELDTVRLRDLDTRAEALESAADEQQPVEPWMHFVADYHGWMRAALVVKIRLARQSVVPNDRAHRVARAAAELTGRPVDTQFVASVADPPAGRLKSVVLDRIAAVHGYNADEIRSVLFPPRVAVDEETI
jgi:hypothetical protein